MPILIPSSVQPALRRIFDRRAAAFDRVAFLPREIAGRMSERLEYIKVEPKRVLDVGCGTGSDLRALSARYPEAQIAGVDFSQAMLRRAMQASTTSARRSDGSSSGSASDGGGLSRWLPEALRRVVERTQGRKQAWCVQADFAHLPLASESVDLVWSNLALQWHELPDQVFPEWQRVLSVGGLLMFSTLGPDSLQELREAWQEADALMHRPLSDEPAAVSTEDGAMSSRPTPEAGVAPRRTAPRRVPVLDFVDMHDFGDMLVASGFELPVMDMERLTITYRDPAALLADVRAWGAFRPQQRRDPAMEAANAALALSDKVVQTRAGLTGKRMHAALLEALARRRQADGTIPLTFEIVYGHAWKAAPRTNADGQAIVRLDDIGGRRRDKR